MTIRHFYATILANKVSFPHLLKQLQMNQKTTENIALTLTPQGLIPAFNALGNHPADLREFIQNDVHEAYRRLGILERFPQDQQILLNAISDLNKKPSHFEGHHIATHAMRKVLRLLIDTFVRIDECTMYGMEHYEKAIQLTKLGHNVLIIQNHTSALDALVAETLIQKHFGKDLPVSYIISQVFEYARIASLITSGIDKFPVFQPKHIALINNKDESGAVRKMKEQNIIALRALGKHVGCGGKMIFLYPEKSRTSEMREPEPVVMKIPELLQIASPKPLYVLSTFVTGLETILPNHPGTNELDDFFKNISVGQGDLYCGQPIEFAKILEVLSSVDQKELSQAIPNSKYIGGESQRLAALSVLMVGLIAHAGPVHSDKGMYGNAGVAKAVSSCFQSQGFALNNAMNN